MTDSIRGRAASCLLLLIVATTIPGCGVFRKKEPRATPATTESAADTDETEAPIPETEPTVPPSLEQPEPLPEDTAEAIEIDPPPVRIKQPTARPPPAKRTAEADSIPSVDQVSPVEPDPEPRLLQDDEEQLTPESLQSDLREAQKLSAELSARELTDEQHAQVESGRGFLEDAREALRLQDLERAGVLLEKSLVLLRDAEASSGS